MNKKNNTCVLIVVFAALLAIFVVSILLKNKGRKARSFRADIIQVDSAAVERIVVTRQPGDKKVILTKENENWMVDNGDIKSPTQENVVEEAISVLSRAEVEQLVANDKQAWGDYGVTDTMATRVELFAPGKDKMLDLYLGRFQYNQRGYRRQQGSSSISGSTYVRPEGKDKVYAVSGFISMHFNKPFNRWRNGTLIETTPSSIRHVACEYPADSSFVLHMQDSVWMIDDTKADQAAVDKYVNALKSKSSFRFADDFEAEADSEPQFVVSISGNNMDDIVLKAWEECVSCGDYTIHSSQNPGVYFTVKKERLFGDIFKRKQDFLPIEQE
ncbi:MAG: DUF4340 domain-containing protein [Bacteroidales bacterium]